MDWLECVSIYRNQRDGNIYPTPYDCLLVKELFPKKAYDKHENEIWEQLVAESII